MSNTMDNKNAAPERPRAKIDIAEETQQKANAIALKWAEKYKRGDVQVWDWDLALAEVSETMRNADVAYYILQAVMEMHSLEYSRGWNDAIQRQSAFAAAMQPVVSESDEVVAYEIRKMVFDLIERHKKAESGFFAFDEMVDTNISAILARHCHPAEVSRTATELADTVEACLWNMAGCGRNKRLKAILPAIQSALTAERQAGKLEV